MEINCENFYFMWLPQDNSKSTHRQIRNFDASSLSPMSVTSRVNYINNLNSFNEQEESKDGTLMLENQRSLAPSILDLELMLPS